MVLFLYLSAWFPIKKIQNENFLFWLIFVLFVLHDGLRWETGTDWVNYYRYFQECLYAEWEQFEPGYVAFSKFIRSFTSDYTIFLFCEAIIVWMLIFVTIKKYSPHPIITTFCLYCTLLPLLGMNRQYIALAISVFSIRFIYERKFVYFIICILCACEFHSSAMIFFISYFLNKKFELKYYYLAVLFSVLILNLGVVNKLDMSFLSSISEGVDERLVAYAEKVDMSLANSSLFGILRKTFWLFLAYPLVKKNVDVYMPLFFNLYFLSLLIYIIFNGSSFQIIVSRASIYFSLYEILLISYAIFYSKYILMKNSLLLFVLFYYSFLLYKNITFYTIGNFNPFIPYQFCEL